MLIKITAANVGVSLMNRNKYILKMLNEPLKKKIVFKFQLNIISTHDFKSFKTDLAINAPLMTKNDSTKQ